MFGSKLVSRLSASKPRRNAVLADVSQIEPKVFEASNSFFSNSFGSAPDFVQSALVRLATGESLKTYAPPRIRRWLDRRNPLDADNRLAHPLFWNLDRTLRRILARSKGVNFGQAWRLSDGIHVMRNLD